MAFIGVLFLVFIPYFLHILLNVDYYWSGEYRSNTVSTPRKVLIDKLIVPTAIVGIPGGIFLCLVALPPLTRKGCEAFNFAWPRFYQKMCDRDTRPKFVDARKTYFSSMERYSEDVWLREDSLKATNHEGHTREIPYSDIVQAFRGDGLMILHTGQPNLPTDEVILDLRPLSKEQKRSLCIFIDSHLPQDCKTYYRRRDKGTSVVTRPEKLEESESSNHHV